MKKIHFQILLIIFFLSNFSFAQDQIGKDNILGELSSIPNDSLKVDTLNSLSWEYRKKDTLTARIYARKGLEIAEKIEYYPGQSTSWNRLGNILEYRGFFIQAVDCYQNSLEIDRRQNDLSGIGRAFYQISVCYKKQGEYNKALEFGINSINIYEQLPLKRANLSIAKNHVGTIYKYLGKFEDAIKIYLESESLRIADKKPRPIALTKMNLGSLYLKIGHHEKAIEYYLESLNILEKHGSVSEIARINLNLGNYYYSVQNFKKALKYYNKVLVMDHNLERELIAAVQNNMASIYEAQGKFKDAKTLYHKSLLIYNKIDDKKGMATSNYNLGVINHKERNYDNALSYFQDALSYIKDAGNIPLEMEIFRNMASTYTSLKIPEKALFYYEQYNDHKDNLFENYKGAMEYRIKYEDALKKNQLLEKEKELKDAEYQKKIIILAAAISIMALLFFSLFFWYRSKQQQIISEEKEKTALQEIDKLLNEQEIKSSYAKLEGQEIEKNRIAQDLHDRLGSMLVTVKLYFQSVDDKIVDLKEENQKQYNKAQDLLDQACDEVRKIASNLISGTLKKFGLVEQLEELVATIQASNKINIELLAFGLTDRLELGLETNIYRIIQELISNILKHSKATEVTIQLNKSEGNLNLLVEDNGKGFNPDEQNKGMGLDNIEARVFELDGKLNIDSGKGSGTTISIDLPV